MGIILTTSQLAQAENGRGLVDAHRAAVQWWSPRMRKAATCIDFLAGRHLTSEERDLYRRKNKTPVEYNRLKPQERALMGKFLQSKWDCKWAAVNPGVGDSLAAGLEALRSFEAQRQQDLFLDSDNFVMAWTTGLAYQEIFMEFRKGFDPRMRTQNLSRLSVYPDPSSRQPILRDDAAFIDIDSWASQEDLEAAFPAKKQWIEEKCRSRGGGTPTSNDSTQYEQYTVSNDRGHETRGYRNGQWKVTERFYRVRRDFLPQKLRGPSISPFTGRPYCEKGVAHAEELWYAVVVEDFGFEFLYNGRYQFQPVDPLTGRIIFPVLEQAFEWLNGDPSGAVEHLIDPTKGFDALMTNLLHSAKHAASNSVLIDYTAFKDEKQAELAMKYHADADRAFLVKQGRAQNAAGAFPHSNVSNDIYRGLDFAQKAFDEIGSVPPAMQGERAPNESGAAFSARVTESDIQLLRATENYRIFLERKYWLRYILQRQFYTQEFEIRLVGHQTPAQPAQAPQGQLQSQTQQVSQPPQTIPAQAPQGTVTLNKRVPAKDDYGFPLPGEVDILNDIGGDLYTITLVESTRSQTNRMKTLQQLSDIAASPTAMQDPVYAGIVLEAQIDLSDLDPKYKEMLSQRKDEVQQSQQASAQATQQAQQAEAQMHTQKGQAATTAAQAQQTMAQAQAQNLQQQPELRMQEIAAKVHIADSKGGGNAPQGNPAMEAAKAQAAQAQAAAQAQQILQAQQLHQQQLAQGEGALQAQQMDLEQKKLAMQKLALGVQGMLVQHKLMVDRAKNPSPQIGLEQ